MLPLVDKALAESKNSMGKRFIVLHLRGSHSSVCERIHALFSRPLTGDAGKEDVYCYETTMRQTDYLLRQLDSVMKKAGETYSILYFADHGASRNMNRGKLVMNHANPANHHRDVPLYRVSSDDKKLVRVRVRRYLSNFTEGVSAWLGVTTEQLLCREAYFVMETIRMSTVCCLNYNGAEMIRKKLSDSYKGI